MHFMASEKPKKSANIGIQVQLDEIVAQGAYCNLAMINHNETEFVFDFIYVQPQQPKAKVRSRIICNPRNAKRLLIALGDNIQVYEKKFGTIPAAKPPSEKLIH
jgi:hypothetical protein